MDEKGRSGRLHQLQQEDYDLDLFFELSPDLLCIAGFDGYFRRVNPAFIKLMGYSEGELLAKPIAALIHPDDREITSAYRANILHGENLLNFENRYITKDGQVVWLAWTSIPLQEKKLVYAIAKNVTFKKKQEEDRNAILADLAKANQEMKQISYSTSHDLRSPVGSLISILSLIDLSTVQNKETLEFFKLIRTSAEKLHETLLTQIKNLKEKEKLQVEIEQVSIKHSLSRVVDSISALIKDSNTSIKADFSDFDIIPFHKLYLDSILLNLITNSIKYARPDIPPFISIRTTIEAGRQKLIYSDNGMGIDMKKVGDKIFGFNQTFHNRSDGEGIGLYLVHTHIASMGGRITLQSEVNEGTTFTIVFAESISE